MNILIIGSGSYVLGDQYGPGVVLRSVLQWLKLECPKKHDCSKILITYENSATVEAKQENIRELCANFLPKETPVEVELLPTEAIEQLMSQNLIEACFVCTPDQQHALYVVKCAKRDIPVWVVKPLTGNLQAAGKLGSLNPKSQSKIWVDYHKRFDASNMHLKILKENGKFGKLLTYNVDYHQPRDLPLSTFSWSKDVDVFTYIGCHYVDQIFYLFPEAELLNIAASGIKGRVYDESGQLDGVLVQAEFKTENGVLLSQMNVGWFNPLGSPAKSLQTVKAQFENGLVELDQTRRGISVWDDNGVALINPYFFGESLSLDGDIIYSGYGYDSVRYFLNLVYSREDWPVSEIIPTLQNALKTEHILDAVKAAIAG